MAIGRTNASAGGSTDGYTPTSGDYKVRFIDYDGTVLKEEWVDSGNAATPPSNPSHTGLTFQEWNYNSTELNNITSDLDVGATYITTSGATELDIRLTTVSGLSPTLYLKKSDTSTLSVDWGDSSTPDTSTDKRNVNFSHTYSTIGDYTISISITSGSGTYNIGQGNASAVVIGGSVQAYRDTLLNCRIGSNVIKIEGYAFSDCRSIKSISIPNNVTSMGTYNVFYNCSSLAAVIFPDSITIINDSAFYNCFSMTTVSIPSGVTSIESYAFYANNALSSVVIPSSVTSIGNQIFHSCYSLASITIPSGVTSIGAYAFHNCYSMLKYIINATSVPTLSATNTFTGINTICKIYVPDSSVDAYKADTNWSIYANYIYPMSDL